MSSLVNEKQFGVRNCIYNHVSCRLSFKLQLFDFKMANAKLSRALMCLFEMCKDAVEDYRDPEDPRPAESHESLANELEMLGWM